MLFCNDLPLVYCYEWRRTVTPFSWVQLAFAATWEHVVVKGDDAHVLTWLGKVDVMHDPRSGGVSTAAPRRLRDFTELQTDEQSI